MIYNIEYNSRTYEFERYPKTENRSLQAWNAGDQYVLQYLESLELTNKEIGIYLDRFGFLAVMLAEYQLRMITEFASQEQAIGYSLELNNMDASKLKTSKILDEDYTLDLALMKMPKSMDQFEMQLNQISKVLKEDGEVIISFMTKTFTPQSIKIAEKYFDEVEQTLAFKKSRLMILKGKKSASKDLIKTVSWNNIDYKQHFGVFSANHIDYATQFMLEVVKIKDTEKVVLDLASGNGVIAKYIVENNDIDAMHLVDDSLLAIESSKMNCEGDVYHFHYADGIADIENESLDLVISNPPFHFDNENNIEVSVGLFAQVKTKMKERGRFILVANKHLNYWTHLEKIFPNTEVMAIDDKFEVYDCRN